VTADARSDRLDLLLELVALAARRQALVNIDQLRRLAHQEPRWRLLTPRLSRDLAGAVRDGTLLSEARQRLSRTGELREIRLYRLNPRRERGRGMDGG
jgi:hypothetical protein